ncbi:MAG: DJ-1/PfpI family protein [Paludibacter sp.]|nr:DJ-1/PfpI family protein [Paludibacter sp.]
MKRCLLLSVVLLSLSYSLQARNPHLLMVVPPELYHDTEFSDPMLALDSAGIQVTIASTKIGTIKGVIKDSIQATLLLKNVKVTKYDAICIMGGKGTGKYLWENEELKKLIQQFEKKGKLITGICAGAVSLAKAGVLQTKNSTTFPTKGFIEQLKLNGAIYSPSPVVVDGKYITANGPEGAKEFGKAIAKALTK